MTTFEQNKAIKEMLKEFNDTGCLPENKDLVLKAIEAYKAIVDASFSLPEMNMVFLYANTHMIRLQDIAKARGYINK